MSPDNHLFVIHVSAEDRSAVTQRLTVWGSLRPLNGTDTLLFSVPATSNVRIAWNQAQEIVGTAGSVQPVLLDEDGEPHYPTGEISVRFRDTLGDEELQSFAARHDLRLLRRNELVPQQAVFQPLDASGSYLPELVQRLEREKRTLSAWANTLSRYQRAS
jgi:hypothetical protein